MSTVCNPLPAKTRTTTARPDRTADARRTSEPLTGTFRGALHLATASEHGATVHTLDQRLAEAGPVLGVPTQLLA